MTPAKVKELLDYDPISGLFIWKERLISEAAEEIYHGEFRRAA